LVVESAKLAPSRFTSSMNEGRRSPPVLFPLQETPQALRPRVLARHGVPTMVRLGETRFFQFMPRGPHAGGALLDASDAYSVTFCH
jgi:hypothetical protein